MNNFMNNLDKTTKRLRKSAFSYLARYEVSEYQFEITMKRKLSYFENSLNETEKTKVIKVLKDEMIKAHFIDDKRYAETKVRSIRRQGGSERFIHAKLNEKRISNNLIRLAIETVDEGNENAEIKAALTFMKKKNIGIFYKNNNTVNQNDVYTLREKWLSALSRRGFPLEIIKKVINIDDISNANQILEETI